MTDAFNAKFAELCEAEPEKFEMHELTGRPQKKYWIDDDIYLSVDDKSHLWFLHKLAEALGGVVWALPRIGVRDKKIAYWAGFSWNGKTNFHNTHDTQELALESAVIGLMGWYLYRIGEQNETN